MNLGFCLLLLIQSTASLASLSLTETRQLYVKAATDESACRSLVKKLADQSTSKHTTLAGYKACAHMMMANYVYSPISKLSYFNEGKDLLEKCILADRNNIELRFLRFAVQSNVPSFLGYSNELSKDKKFLLSEIQNVTDLELKEMILSFLKSSDHVSKEEKAALK
jgi:hypothetical protein